MKLTKLLLLKLLPIACFLISCGPKETTTNLKLKKIYVQSGKIDKETFIGNTSFAASDTVIGKIDSTTKNSNGYLGSDNYIYVFEGNTIPKAILDFTEIDLAKKLVSAKWKKDTVYKLKKDAFLLEKPPLYYIREKGEYKREVTLIDENKVFRTENKYVIEDYTNLMTYHKEIRTEKNSINFFTALGISPQTHRISVSRPGLVIDTKTGSIDNKKSTNTPKNTQDKITFEPINGGNTYRLRVIVAQYEAKTKTKFFNQNGMVPSALNLEWIRHLNKNVLKNYFENGLKGFEKSQIIESSLTKEPPPPILNGTGE